MNEYAKSPNVQCATEKTVAVNAKRNAIVSVVKIMRIPVFMNSSVSKLNSTQRSGICAVGGFIYSSPAATDAERCY